MHIYAMYELMKILYYLILKYFKITWASFVEGGIYFTYK